MYLKKNKIPKEFYNEDFIKEIYFQTSFDDYNQEDYVLIKPNKNIPMLSTIYYKEARKRNKRQSCYKRIYDYLRKDTRKNR